MIQSKETAHPKRLIKVSRAFSETKKPMLRLSGKWLAEAGFNVGTAVEVEIRDGSLVVTAISEETGY